MSAPEGLDVQSQPRPLSVPKSDHQLEIRSDSEPIIRMSVHSSNAPVEPRVVQQPLFPVHTIPASKTRTNYQKATFQARRPPGTLPPTFLNSQRQRSQNVIGEEGPTVKQHLQQQQKQGVSLQLKDKERQLMAYEGPSTSTEGKTYNIQVHPQGQNAQQGQIIKRTVRRKFEPVVGTRIQSTTRQVYVSPGVTTSYPTASQISSSPYIVQSQPLDLPSTSGRAATEEMHQAPPPPQMIQQRSKLEYKAEPEPAAETITLPHGDVPFEGLDVYHHNGYQNQPSTSDVSFHNQMPSAEQDRHLMMNDVCTTDPGRQDLTAHRIYEGNQTFFHGYALQQQLAMDQHYPPLSSNQMPNGHHEMHDQAPPPAKAPPKDPNAAETELPGSGISKLLLADDISSFYGNGNPASSSSRQCDPLLGQLDGQDPLTYFPDALMEPDALFCDIPTTSSSGKKSTDDSPTGFSLVDWLENDNIPMDTEMNYNEDEFSDIFRELDGADQEILSACQLLPEPHSMAPSTSQPHCQPPQYTEERKYAVQHHQMLPPATSAYHHPQQYQNQHQQQPQMVQALHQQQLHPHPNVNQMQLEKPKRERKQRSPKIGEQEKPFRMDRKRTEDRIMKQKKAEEDAREKQKQQEQQAQKDREAIERVIRAQMEQLAAEKEAAEAQQKTAPQPPRNRNRNRNNSRHNHRPNARPQGPGGSAPAAPTSTGSAQTTPSSSATQQGELSSQSPSAGSHPPQEITQPDRRHQQAQGHPEHARVHEEQPPLPQRPPIEDYENWPTEVLWSMVENPKEMFNEYQLNVLEQMGCKEFHVAPEDLVSPLGECVLEPPSSLQGHDLEQFRRDEEIRAHIAGMLMLMPENEHVDELDFLESQLLAIEQANEEVYMIKLKQMKEDCRSIVYANAALIDEISRLANRVIVTTEERKTLARRICHHQRNYIRRLQTANRRRKEHEKKREEEGDVKGFDDELFRSLTQEGPIGRCHRKVELNAVDLAEFSQKVHLELDMKRADLKKKSVISPPGFKLKAVKRSKSSPGTGTSTPKRRMSMSEKRSKKSEDQEMPSPVPNSLPSPVKQSLSASDPNGTPASLPPFSAEEPSPSTQATATEIPSAPSATRKSLRRTAQNVNFADISSGTVTVLEGETEKPKMRRRPAQRRVTAEGEEEKPKRTRRKPSAVAPENGVDAVEPEAPPNPISTSTPLTVEVPSIGDTDMESDTKSEGITPSPSPNSESSAASDTKSEKEGFRPRTRSRRATGPGSLISGEDGDYEPAAKRRRSRIQPAEASPMPTRHSARIRPQPAEAKEQQ